jgi:hypothetical protein
MVILRISSAGLLVRICVSMSKDYLLYITALKARGTKIWLPGCEIGQGTSWQFAEMDTGRRTPYIDKKEDETESKTQQPGSQKKRDVRLKNCHYVWLGGGGAPE